MWLKRTPEEILKWEKNAGREAVSHGRMIAGIVWLIASLALAGGWFFIFSAATPVAIQRSVAAPFLERLPVFGILVAPFAYYIFRKEKRKELARISRRTVCPACDTAGTGNAGATCECGGCFVPVGFVKWVEQPPSPKS